MDKKRSAILHWTEISTFHIVRKEGFSEAYNGNNIIATISCEDLVACDTALVAKEASGLYSIYLPVLDSVNNCYYFEDSLIRIMTNVKEFYYYSKKKAKFNEGILVLKVETGVSCGYWTAINLEVFERDLDPDIAKERLLDLFQIPYEGDSKITFMEEFDYLPSYRAHLVKIDDVVHLIYKHGPDQCMPPIDLQTLGKIEIEPLPFKDYFKVKSIEGESFFVIKDGCKKAFGSFPKISKVTLEHEDCACYFAYDKDGNILGMFYEKYYECGKYEPVVQIILFDTPIQQVEFIEKLDFDGGIIASWKLSYCDGDTKILLSAFSSNMCQYTLLDLSKYI